MKKHSDNAKVFMAFCDETRLKVLELLRNGETYAGALVEQLRVKQSDLSYHMKILVESGIVAVRRVDKYKYYSICESGRQYAAELVKRLTDLTCKEKNKASVPSV